MSGETFRCRYCEAEMHWRYVTRSATPDEWMCRSYAACRARMARQATQEENQS